jgi:hypothetical protein
MNTTLRFTDDSNPGPVPGTAEAGNPRPHVGRTAPQAVRRRFRPVTIGFWLGGLALAMAGCNLGACLPYRHSVGVMASALWWGLYLGCTGASLGALIGLWWDHVPASPSGAGASRDRHRLEVATGAAIAEPVRSPVHEDRFVEASSGGPAAKGPRKASRGRLGQQGLAVRPIVANGIHPASFGPRLSALCSFCGPSPTHGGRDNCLRSNRPELGDADALHATRTGPTRTLLAQHPCQH